jgi:hypothetical protein
METLIDQPMDYPLDRKPPPGISVVTKQISMSCDPISMEILSPIPVQVDLLSIKKSAHTPEGEEERLLALLTAAHSVMAAKAVYRVSYIELRREDCVVIDGVTFRSRVLRKHFDKVERVFPYVVTLGSGVEALEKASGDAVEKYYLDLIGNAAVVKAREHLKDTLGKRYGLEGLSYLGPGQLKDWPLEEQKPLFSLLGDVESAVGVGLSESLLMIPRKSLSGIYFPTEIPFMACQLCARENCPSRKARYDEKLAKEYNA